MMIQARDGQPPTGSPQRSVLMMITRIAIKAMMQNSNPTTAEITSGVVEKATIPSIAYANSFRKLN